MLQHTQLSPLEGFPLFLCTCSKQSCLLSKKKVVLMLSAFNFLFYAWLFSSLLFFSHLRGARGGFGGACTAACTCKDDPSKSAAPRGSARTRRLLPSAPWPRCCSPPAAQEASAPFKTSLVPGRAAGEAAGLAPAGCISEGLKLLFIFPFLLLKSRREDLPVVCCEVAGEGWGLVTPAHHLPSGWA